MKKPKVISMNQPQSKEIMTTGACFGKPYKYVSKFICKWGYEHEMFHQKKVTKKEILSF